MATRKTKPETEVEMVAVPDGMRTMTEDASASTVKGDNASPESVYAELEAAKTHDSPSERDVRPIPALPEDFSKVQELDNETLVAHGGRIEGDYLWFGDRVFFADPEKRRTVPNKQNFAAGPRRTTLPVEGEFLEGTKTFRRVPFRTPGGRIRVDN